MLVASRLLGVLMFASMVGCIGACIDAGYGDACNGIGWINIRSDASCIGVCIDVARSEALMSVALVLWVALMSLLMVVVSIRAPTLVVLMSVLGWWD